MIDPHDLTVIFKLLLASGLSGLMGYERQHWRKPGGIRTYMLVGVGSVLFTILSAELISQFPNTSNINPTRLTVGVLTGIGFIGAGMVVHKGNKTTGLTTAAGIWVTSAIAMAIGYGYYLYGTVTALIAFVSLTAIGYYSKKEIRENNANGDDDDDD